MKLILLLAVSLAGHALLAVLIHYLPVSERTKKFLYGAVVVVAIVAVGSVIISHAHALTLAKSGP